jgi:RimJ/RimL family protein N-acetyltransferase
VTLDLSTIDLTTEVVRTDRLVLRPCRPDDVVTVLRACQDPEIQRWISAIPLPYTEEAARAWVCEQAPQARTEGRGMPTLVEADGEVVGSSGVNLVPGRLGPEIGYWIAPWARGHGYAAEAAHGLAEWALGLGAPRVHLYTDVGNIASQVTARKAGFTQEGVVRSCLEYQDGTRADALLFSRLPGD